MEIPAPEDDYEKAKRRAKVFYKSIQRIWCPGLKDYIVFTKTGFRHLLGKGRKPRSKKDQLRRFLLIPFVEDALTHASQIIHRENIETKMQFWALSIKRDGEMITVVVRAVGDGRKHFFSVYNQKIA